MMKRHLKKLTLTLLLAGFQLAAVWAQCPMCRTAVESNLKNGGTEGAGLNTGIMYLLLAPYLIVAVLGYMWYKNRKEVS